MSNKASPSHARAQAAGNSDKADEVSFKDKEAASPLHPLTLEENSPPQKQALAAASLHPSLETYSKPIARKICEELSKGRTLKAVCASSKTYPLPHIVRRWAMEDIDGFAVDYARARELGFLTMADELIEIVDREDGNITRDKLRVDTRKWLLSKAMPKGFGETPEVKASVKIGLDETDYEMGKRIAFALELSSRAGEDRKE